MKWSLVAGAVSVAVLSFISPAGATPLSRPCSLVTPVDDVERVSELPAKVVALLAPVADVGEPFNSGDDIELNLAERRLIRAGHRGDDWFVWYEHGGFAPFWQAVMIRVAPGGGEP